MCVMRATSRAPGITGQSPVRVHERDAGRVLCASSVFALWRAVGQASLPLLPPGRSSLPRGRGGRAERCTEPRFRARWVGCAQNVGWFTT